MSKLICYQGYLFLSLAIVANVIGTVFMKLSLGLKKIGPSILLFVCYLISFIAMTLALKYMDLGKLYAIWSGIGTLMVTVIGFMCFDETFDIRKGIFLLLIIIGIVGIHSS